MNFEKNLRYTLKNLPFKKEYFLKFYALLFKNLAFCNFVTPFITAYKKVKINAYNSHYTIKKKSRMKQKKKIKKGSIPHQSTKPIKKISVEDLENLTDYQISLLTNNMQLIFFK